MQKNLVVETLLSLKKYVEDEQYRGWDPYDGLNSEVFQSLFFQKYKIPKWIWIQLFKRNPINLRPLFKIPKQHNTKGLGLFLYGYCQLYSIAERGNNSFGSKEEVINRINYLVNLLDDQSTKGYNGACWGYNFDWQNRVFFQPKGTPTVVATSFVANALFEAYEITKNTKTLELALSSCQFIVKDLNRTTFENGKFIFSYSPLDNSQVYNASLLGARLLARGYSYTKNPEWLELSQKSVETICDLQCIKGSWVYGSNSNQQWIDSFHTGFNLECLFDYQLYTKDNAYHSYFENGLNYYINNFFLKDGTPKYYNNKKYPIDIHSPAQFLFILTKINQYEKYKYLADKVLHYTLTNLKSKDGYFYYQLKPIGSSKIPYMRWAQAWMFYSLSSLLNKTL